MNIIDKIEEAYLKKSIPDFRAGDTVRVHVKIKEGDKERIQAFQGVVIRRSHGGIRETFTVRKVSYGVGVERTFPLHAPSVDKIEVLQHGKVRRAKLYYLRNLSGRAARIASRARVIQVVDNPKNSPTTDPDGEGEESTKNESSPSGEGAPKQAAASS